VDALSSASADSARAPQHVGGAGAEQFDGLAFPSGKPVFPFDNPVSVKKRAVFPSGSVVFPIYKLVD
jgi:hypothetical protein